ncbi:MAG: L,D-transpeptidase [Candidatus Colwellbacteria bacterium]|nr:L,D-transpeptidase [Candidatus Colwellbacteria bacterium]
MKRLNNALFVFVALLFIFGIAFAAEGSNRKIDGYVQVVDGCEVVLSGCLNVRLGPGTGFKKTHVLRIGAIVKVDKEIEDKNGRPWYRIKQDSPLSYPERAQGDWYVAAEHTIWVNVPSEPRVDAKKKIVVDLSEQKLYAYESDKIMIESAVSTGIRGAETSKGEFKILYKKPSRYMQCPLPGMTDYCDFPGVPWAMFFTWDGAALHGAPWHNDFGKKRSHGCVNLPIDKAEWLYRWATVGTKVIVTD